ncbi:hypothetical protein RRG08_003661 [Elysia crispata]|uniref:CABIT domain-containing protein n=1 Tax=Elysia crispata TaxID=231223 RepID=A0AAE1AUZ1_9GAST|nr:hypothetical protein RRG08_003661 [Elysia crispata]
MYPETWMYLEVSSPAGGCPLSLLPPTLLFLLLPTPSLAISLILSHCLSFSPFLLPQPTPSLSPFLSALSLAEQGGHVTDPVPDLDLFAQARLVLGKRPQNPPQIEVRSVSAVSRKHHAPAQQRPDSSRLADVVIDNPVNQAADWTQHAFALQDLLERFPLPQIVRSSDRLLPGEDSNLPVNVHVPLLLFSGRSARKLLAKHVAPNLQGRGHVRLTETDESIVIPEDYDGHFLRLQARTTNDNSVVRSLLYIAKNPVAAFVNFTPVVSFFSDHQNYGVQNFAYTEDGNSYASSGLSSKRSAQSQLQLQQQKMLHPPGSVFMVSGTTKGVVNLKKKSREVILLRCTDPSGKELHIPTDQPGEFIEVEIPPNGSMKLSILPRDLIAANRYPGLVRFVYGENAPRLTPCSLMFMLVDTFSEDSVIGCLLYPNHAMLIEIPLMSSLSFQVALNRDALMTLPLPRHAMRVVEARRETFVRDLKLKVKFIHRVNSAAQSNREENDEDLASATVRTRLLVNEAFFYL